MSHKMPHKIANVLLVLIALLIGQVSAGAAGPRAASSPEGQTTRYFQSVQHQPSLVYAFLRQMPKGGDLHNHLSGAIYAESFIRFAAQDGLCVDRATSALLRPPCDAAQGHPPASAAYQDPNLYRQMIDAYSMRQFHAYAESGHDHFFATFGKFGPATDGHTGEMLAEVASRAARDNVEYLELMFNPDGGQAARLGTQLGWNDDLATLRQKLLAGGLKDVIASGSRAIDEAEAKMRDELHCGSIRPDPGCQVKLAYLYQVARGLPKEMVFAQILAGFEMAGTDPRVVGLNLVMPEDAYIPMNDFRLHMQMIDYLHGVYPKVHITLHAGELTPQLVPPEGMFHIRSSIERGHAERIGHGVDVMYEDNAVALLREMAERHTLVEICLTSNDVILGVKGDHHPLPMYLRYGVPVALATDDEGVSRSDMTREYQRAAETYGLGYRELKNIARNSIAYSFLPGQSLWSAAAKFSRVGACAKDDPQTEKLSAACREFLEASERAQQQWKLEKAFSRFEKSFQNAGAGK